MAREIVSLARRAELIPVVAGWLWGEWSRHRGRSVEAVAQRLAARAAAEDGPEATFVALDGGVPVATASLTLADLGTRPDLTPWLASVYVDPPHRGRGHAAALVRAVEDAARAQGTGTLWLYTRDAAGLYAGLGWVEAARDVDMGHAVTVMRRELGRA
jgi:GNAT superfamily N-acetyltransferase